MARSIRLSAIALALLAAAPAALAAHLQPLDRAIERSGGAEALRQIQRVRRNVVTQWLRPNVEPRPAQPAAAPDSFAISDPVRA